MPFFPRSATEPVSRLQWLRIACIAAAFAYGTPIASSAYDQLIRVNEQARTRLIQHHRLWELEIGYRGRPETWTRMAARLLNDRQLLARVALKYGGQAPDIELEYRRDVTIARAEVVGKALVLWGGPLLALYGLAWLARRRNGKAPVRVQPASIYDPRYRPPA
ncbi:MAG TPA: hypothetical protein VED01_11085 [Burkholderiales bacterium]|nr:hypothetical protein [Burkholderiales bacterium]